jgi:hypothetical protein
LDGPGLRALQIEFVPPPSRYLDGSRLLTEYEDIVTSQHFTDFEHVTTWRQWKSKLAVVKSACRTGGCLAAPLSKRFDTLIIRRRRFFGRCLCICISEALSERCPDSPSNP